MLLMAALVAWGLPALAQSEEDVEEEGTREKWHLTAAGVYQDTSYGRNAHQTRADDEDGPWQYKEGDSDGDGDGLRLAVGRGREQMVFTYVNSDYRFVNAIPETATTRRFIGRHEVDTSRKDYEFMYRRTMSAGLGASENGDWGWSLGVRRAELDSKIEIFEQARERKETKNVDAEVTWQLLTGGYFGLWRPMGQPYLTLYGFINGLLGEADGTARHGNDNKLDGVVSEQYRDNSSMVYGLNAGFGAVLSYKQMIGIGADYGREWLYSFEATDSGTVVFPDNNDALFIENQHVARFYGFVSLAF